MEESLILNRYRPLAKAGAGAFGTVQVAWDTTIQRKVAIKCIRLSDADAYALTRDGASMPGAVPPRNKPYRAIGPDGAFRTEEEAQRFGSAAIAQMAAGLSDDEYGDGSFGGYGASAKFAPGGFDENPGQDEWDRDPWARITSWFGGSLRPGTEKLPASEQGGARGKGITPLYREDDFRVAPIDASGFPAMPTGGYLDGSRSLAMRKGASALGGGAASPGSGGSFDGGPFAGGAGTTGDLSIGQAVSTEEHYLTDLPGLDEARTAALLSDAHIVAVYDFQVVDRVAYLIMEYVEGMTLTRFLRDFDEELSLDIIGAIFADIAQALMVAHGSGVLHLDIKPDNVLIDRRGQVKVTDFGLATLADAQGFGLAGGGTIGYMPPEQMHQEQLDARTDEWALASITYEMLTGKNPFVNADTIDEALDVIDEAELVLPSLCWRGVDARMDDAIFKALDPERDGRYDSVSDFVSDLQVSLGNVDEGHQRLAEIVSEADMGNLMDTAAPGWDKRAGGLLGSLGIFGEGRASRGATVAGRTQQPRPSSSWGAGFGGAFAGAALRGAGDDFAEAGDRRNAYRGGDGYDNSSAGDRTSRGSRGFQPSRSNSRRNRATKAPRYNAPELPPIPVVKKPPAPTATLAGGHFFGIWGRIMGFVLSAALMLLACVNIPVFGGVEESFLAPFFKVIWPAALEVPALQNPTLWLIVLAVGALGAFMPSWGGVVALTALGVALAWEVNFVLGILVMLASWGWFYLVARFGTVFTNCALAFPVLGSFGCTPLAVFATGIGMRVFGAVCTTLFGVFLCMVFAMLGSGDVMNWQLVSFWNFAECNFSAGVDATLGSFRTWILAAGWLAAAVVGGFCTIPRRRWINVLGAGLSGLVITLSLCLATWVASEEGIWLPAAAELIKLGVCWLIALAAAALFIPEPRRKRRVVVQQPAETSYLQP